MKLFGNIDRYWKTQTFSMYEIGRYFLQHKFVVKRNRKRGRG